MYAARCPDGVLVVDDNTATLRCLACGLRLNGFVGHARRRRSVHSYRTRGPAPTWSPSATPGRGSATTRSAVACVPTGTKRGADALRTGRPGGPDRGSPGRARRLSGQAIRVQGTAAPAAGPLASPPICGHGRACANRWPGSRHSGREVPHGGSTVRLTRREFALLEVLARNASIVLTHAQLIDRVWGYDLDATTPSIRSSATFAASWRRGPRMVHTVCRHPAVSAQARGQP
ncbi:winged helix-turn-helix domain-containing protein [Kitasatospora sp. DSM 101779]|uniref:winged helix-turn-helix domain-containing protein n=1 Tax=Kitasatospora sp. DSM 101779 TaxID=2853165 RepID=UPI0021D9DF82|nr:winged helix-turn-helix domain-containing protein [Kitasatospora sp. DSM 101779]